MLTPKKNCSTASNKIFIPVFPFSRGQDLMPRKKMQQQDTVLILGSQKFKDLFGQRLYQYVFAQGSHRAFSSRVNFLQVDFLQNQVDFVKKAIWDFPILNTKQRNERMSGHGFLQKFLIEKVMNYQELCPNERVEPR